MRTHTVHGSSRYDHRTRTKLLRRCAEAFMQAAYCWRKKRKDFLAVKPASWHMDVARAARAAFSARAGTCATPSVALRARGGLPVEIDGRAKNPDPPQGDHGREGVLTTHRATPRKEGLAEGSNHSSETRTGAPRSPIAPLSVVSIRFGCFCAHFFLPFFRAKN